MNNEEPRPLIGMRRMRNGKSWLWEHVQIDFAPDTILDGEEPIHRFRDWGIEIRAVAVDGTILDFTAVSTNNASIRPTLPPFDIQSESYGPYRHSLVYRSWEIESLGVTIHVESWVEKGKGGFVDVFTRSGGE